VSHLNRWLCLPQFRCSLLQLQPRHPWSVLFSSGHWQVNRGWRLGSRQARLTA
jgi:hypothetical protein